MPKLSEIIKTLDFDLEVCCTHNLDADPIFFLVDETAVFLKVLPISRIQKVAYFGYPDSDGIGSYSSRRIIVEEGNANSVFIKGFESNEDDTCVETADDGEIEVFRVSEMRALRFVWEPILTVQ